MILSETYDIIFDIIYDIKFFIILIRPIVQVCYIQLISFLADACILNLWL